MKIKRFFAADMRQAIRLVRDEHGPDAVILSSRKVDGGIEIISAVDYDQNLVSEMVGSTQPRIDVPAYRDKDAFLGADELPEAVLPGSDYHIPDDHIEAPAQVRQDTAAPAEVVWSQDPAIVEMRRELESLRGLLHDQLSQLAWGDYSRRSPMSAQVIRRLMRIGLAPKLARRLAEGVQQIRDPEHAWRQALHAFAQGLKVSGDDIVSRGGIHALVGPTGVGKTTTIAKLAARYAQRHGRRHVALISADNYRIGAHRQLLSFGQILGVETLSVANREELQQRLFDLSDKKLVLIDTAGMSQRDVRLAEQFQALAEAPVIKTQLVVSATAERAVLEEVVRAFGRAPVRGCILTKVDEAVSLGAALSVAISNQLPLSYVSDGQRVPEDLHPARVSRLISRAVALAQTHEKAEAEIAARARGGAQAHPDRGHKALGQKRIRSNAHV